MASSKRGGFEEGSCPHFPVCCPPPSPASSGLITLFPATSSHCWSPKLPPARAPLLSSAPFPGLPCTLASPPLVPSCGFLPQMAPWKQGLCLWIPVSSALSTRSRRAGKGSIHTLVKAPVFKLCSALSSLQKKKKKISVVK